MGRADGSRQNALLPHSKRHVHDRIRQFSERRQPHSFGVAGFEERLWRRCAEAALRDGAQGELIGGAAFLPPLSFGGKSAAAPAKTTSSASSSPSNACRSRTPRCVLRRWPTRSNFARASCRRR